MLVAWLSATAGLQPAAAQAAQTSSVNVAVIDGNGAGNGGTLPESGTVAGAPGDDFGLFTFTDMSDDQIDPADLAGYDTIVLNQVDTGDLDSTQEQTLSNFVTSGGKLIILDADGTAGNDYSWLPVPAGTGTSCLNCGNTDGSLTIDEDSELISSDPSSPDYIDISELPGNTDAAGDANVLQSSDPRWDEAVTVSNDNNVAGFGVAYATDGGLIIYDGLDTDDIGDPEPSGTDWLGKLYFQALALPWDPDSLPHSHPITGTGCGRRSITVGAVTVCADSINGGGGVLQATGNVILDSGVSVGDGPIQIDANDSTIASSGPAPIALERASGPVSLGTTAFSIDTNATTDPTSGESNVAAVTLTDTALSTAGETAAGLSVSLPEGDGATLYLDPAHGGGLIGSGTVSLPILAAHPSGALSVGMYAGLSGVTPLGGSVNLGSFSFARGWGFGPLSLSYRSATQTWAASGKLTAPVGSLTASGSLIGGGLDSIGVSIGGQAVPLGDSGFFFSDFGGSVSGLVKGPLALTASTGGYWGDPETADEFEPFYLDKASLTISGAGSVSIDGAVSFVLRDHSPLSGELHLRLGLLPFGASGSVSVKGSLPTISLAATDRAAFTTKHFTAQGQAKLTVDLLTGIGTDVLSDHGFGAAGKVCLKEWSIAHQCVSTGLVVNWSDLSKLVHGHLSVLSHMIGTDPSSLVTVPDADAQSDARSRPEAIRVRPGRQALLISAIGRRGAPHLALTPPHGRPLTASSRAARAVFGRQGRLVSEIAVLRPRPGVWHLLVLRGPAVRDLHATTLHRVVPLSARPLVVRKVRHGRERPGVVRLRWSSRGLSQDVRVAIEETRSAGSPVGARVLKAGLRARGSLTVPISKLRRGRDHFVLVASEHNVPFQRVAVPGVVRRR